MDRLQQKLLANSTKMFKLMPDRATVVRSAFLSDGAGGERATRTDVYVDLPCRIDPQKGILADKVSERVVGGALTGIASYVLALPLGTLLENGDIIEVRSRNLSFEVIGAAVSSYRLTVGAVCVQVVR